MRLGLLGGTFDPPHLGHLAAARAALDALGLDRVDFLPAHDPWQKTGQGRSVTPAGIRLEMVRALVADSRGLGVDDREIRRGGPTYTADTLAEITRDAPGAELFLIMGVDTARGFPTWQRHGDVGRLSTLVVVSRGNERPSAPAGAARVEFVSMDPVDVSSSEVRAAVAAGENVTGSVGPAVAGLVASHGLYRGHT